MFTAIALDDVWPWVGGGRRSSRPKIYCTRRCRDAQRAASRRRSKQRYWRSPKGRKATSKWMVRLRRSSVVAQKKRRTPVAEKLSFPRPSLSPRRRSSWRGHPPGPRRRRTTDERRRYFSQNRSSSSDCATPAYPGKTVAALTPSSASSRRRRRASVCGNVNCHMVGVQSPSPPMARFASSP